MNLFIKDCRTIKYLCLANSEPAGIILDLRLRVGNERMVFIQETLTGYHGQHNGDAVQEA